MELIFLDVFSDIFSEVAKVGNVFALIGCIAALATMFFAWNSAKELEFRRLLLLSAIFIAIAAIGVYAYIYTYKDNEKEIEKQKNEIQQLRKDNETHFVNEQRNISLKDTCISDRNLLKSQIDAITERNIALKRQYAELRATKNRLEEELRQHNGYRYKFKDGFAVVRDAKSGMCGYLRKDFPAITINYDYKDACMFSDGMGGVKYNSSKWGFVNKSLGKPIIDCIYSDIQSFENGKAKVLLNNKWIWINKKGQKIGDFVIKDLASK